MSDRENMLTKVYLDGPMGEKFGHEWDVKVSSPGAALKLIDANAGGLLNWIRKYSNKYTHYQVVVEYQDGIVESMTEAGYAKRAGHSKRKMSSIRFVPIILGSGKWTQAIIGAILIVVGTYTGSSEMITMGLKVFVGGIVSALLSQTSNARLSSDQGASSTALISEAFDGPTNNTQQGVPVPLIYGRILIGSQVISAGLIVAQKTAA